MNWFGRKSGAPARPPLARALMAWTPGASGWDAAVIGGDTAGTHIGYEGQVREAYGANPVAQRAVRTVAEGLAGLTLDATPEGHPALALIAPHRLRETIAVHLLLHGNAYLVIACDADGSPRTLYPLRPERVTVEPDARGWPAFYRYRVAESVARYPAVDALGKPGLIHLRAMNPLDDHYGLGCLGAAAGAVTLHNAATKWNKALLDNAARPSGAIVYDPGEPGAVLSGEQFDRLKAEMSASFAGSANAGRPMLLEGGLKWQALGFSPADMDFGGLKATAAREIALAFGVPPMLLGLPGDNTYANYAEANRALWRLTILPMAERVLDGVVEALAAWWPDFAVAVDLDGIPELTPDRERLWSMVGAADFLSADEKRATLGFGPREGGA